MVSGNDDVAVALARKVLSGDDDVTIVLPDRITGTDCGIICDLSRKNVPYGIHSNG